MAVKIRTASELIYDFIESTQSSRMETLFEIDEFLHWLLELKGEEYLKMKTVQFEAYPDPELHGVAEKTELLELADKVDSGELTSSLH